MPQEHMNDIIVILPGFLGSTLQKHGKDVWGASFATLSITLRKALLNRELLLVGDDPTVDDLGDGIRAVGLMSDITMIPKLWKVEGYSTLWKFLTETFDVVPGVVNTPNPHANLFAFPYDWRRDNCVAARWLKQFIDRHLPLWRDHSGQADAKVILIGHSMGGLVARHYLEVLGGWEYCRALFTLGTPHRGSIDALDYLSNGHHVVRADVSNAVRSFTSTYQVLPNYRMIEQGNDYVRVAEMSSIHGVVQERAQQAFDFHKDITNAAKARRSVESTRDAYITFPIVGIQQETFQSATVVDGKIVPSTNMPATLHAFPSHGDGTVPYISAIPAELAEEYREMFIVEKHGFLQSRDDVLEQLRQHIVRTQVPRWDAILGPSDKTKTPLLPAISLTLEDLYCTDEQIEVRAKVLDTPEHLGALEAQITSLNQPNQPSTYPLQETDDGWRLTLEDQPTGLYRIRVQPSHRGPQSPTAVHDVFEVIDRTEV
ncbi:MAG: lecithin--cholesterol acyltransferase [Chloroflexi bacterium AL-W]|nr:lecithin--cholesterol acyltransferase [Chloroflexi bacterium AL-N1]NOK68728.1 lecithin--cholesterol acyltransferase [Chloroflexi bacterium AL-N10]NOK76214.1 lecithin--cholesterol acyltransferase [Chloroflexi bacterium AL-N5]NOK84149.1 lecithin--cholesterol acyltransferase [Chloroflexi bacterium AL-W]NOK91352.1 lecithin--cholesterol acyltransferase [Chloroflexi bacterium AL-N15]